MGTDYPADMGEIDPIGFIEGAPGSSAEERTRDPRPQRGAAAGDCGSRSEPHRRVIGAPDGVRLPRQERKPAGAAARFPRQSACAR